MTAVTGPYPLDGVQMPTWLLRFDEHGACTSPATRQQLLAHVQEAQATDLIVFSHGWNNDFAEATQMYGELLQRFEALAAQHAPQRKFKPLFIGIVWPSTWLPSDSGPIMASAGVAAQAEAVLGQLAQRVAATSGPAGLERVYALLAAPGIDDADAAELARLIAPAFGVMTDEGAAGGGRPTVADDVLAMMRALDAAVPGAAAPDSDDLDDFLVPADGAVSASPTSGAAQAAGSWLGKLDPRVALRLFSLYQMKDRAGTVGYQGVSALLRDLLAINGPLVHGVGHSFGCKVLLSAVCAQPLPRALASLLLLQPAVSHLCFAEAVPGELAAGGYRAALMPERVTAPIFSTYSRRDVPLHDTFHLAVRRDADHLEARIASEGVATTAGDPPSDYAALGGYGPRRAGQALVDPLPEAGAEFAMPAGNPPIVAFDGSAGAIKGHGDVTGPQVAWALHRLIFR